MDDLKVELGYALLPLVNAPDGSDRLTEQIKALRRSLAVEIGICHARCSNSRQRAARRELPTLSRVKEVEAGSGKVWPGNTWSWIRPAGR